LQTKISVSQYSEVDTIIFSCNLYSVIKLCTIKHRTYLVPYNLTLSSLCFGIILLSLDVFNFSFYFSEIAKHLSLPPVKLHCSMLAEDAIKAAVKDYESKKAMNSSTEASSPRVAEA
jgi:NifU-like N terminal domain